MKKFILAIAFVLPTLAFAQKGFEAQVKVAYDYGIDADKNESFGIDFVAGYRLTKQIRLGVGTGISWCEHLFHGAYWFNNRYHKEYREPAAYVPVLLNGKYNFVESSISPYISMDLGYTVYIPFSKAAEENKFGLFFYPCVGCDYSIGKCEVFTQVGYKYQQREYVSLWGTYSNYSQLVLAVGFQF